MLQGRGGPDLIPCPTRGQAPALNDLLGGQVHADVRQLARVPRPRGAGKLVALGMATLQRSVYAPEVPTLAEQGLQTLESNSWNGLLAPRHARRRRRQLNAEVNRRCSAPAVDRPSAKAASRHCPAAPAQFGSRLPGGEIDKYAGDPQRAASRSTDRLGPRRPRWENSPSPPRSRTCLHVPGANCRARATARGRTPSAATKEIARRCRAAGVDTLVVFDTHWLVNANYHINCAPHFRGTYTSNELPHFIKEHAVRVWQPGAGRVLAR